MAGLEAWPLTGWRLFADARQARQPGFQAVTVDRAGRETPVPFADLPAGYQGNVQVLKGFAGLAAGKQAAVCQAWAEAVRDRGGEVAEVRIYQTVTDGSARVGDRGAPPQRTLRFTCRPGSADGRGRGPAAGRGVAVRAGRPAAAGRAADRAGRAAGGAAGQRPYPELATQPPALFRPISFLRLLERMPSPEAVAVLQSFALAAAVLATVGLLTRVTLPLAWLAALPLVAMTSSLGKVVHNDVLLLLCLVPLLPSRAGAAWSLDARLRPVARPGAAFGWPVRTAMVVVAGSYFFSGLAKLLHAGPAWVASGNLRWVLYASSDSQPEPNRFALFVADRPVLAHLVAAATLAVELGFPLVLWRPWLAWLFVPAVVAMHAGIGLAMHLDYSAMAATVVVVMVDWPALADRLLPRPVNVEEPP